MPDTESGILIRYCGRLPHAVSLPGRQPRSAERASLGPGPRARVGRDAKVSDMTTQTTRPDTGAPAALRHRIGPELVGQPVIERTNPADPSQVVVLAPDGDERTVDEAVQAAAVAQPGWARMQAPERGAVLLRAAAILSSRVQAVATDL